MFSSIVRSSLRELPAASCEVVRTKFFVAEQSRHGATVQAEMTSMACGKRHTCATGACDQAQGHMGPHACPVCNVPFW